MQTSSKKSIRNIDGVELSVVDWPMSVIRLNSKDIKNIALGALSYIFQ